MFYSPLRYPGGKGKLSNWVANFMRHNNISGGVYIEPYAGGAAVALYLLLQEYVDHIVINDADPVIYSFWWSVINETDALTTLIRDTPVTIKEREKQLKIINNTDEHSLLEVGFATFFLNRTNRSGILKAGVIGGNQQDGKYKIDARYNKENLIARIQLIAKYKNRITLFNLDAIELLKEPPIRGFKNSLIYLDPPYFKKGSQLYRNFYNPSDHAAIRDSIKKLTSPWIITYDNCDEINQLYSDFPQETFSITYSTHMSRNKGSEVLIYNPNLQLQNIPLKQTA
ncbi:DNA adenine methylase [Sulfurimonas sp. HSL-3221]|uniref:DNA adenine methylase n=1 Tax=Thiomicrolovo sulfuroxydans TaxID=2894755 RepID=UPI001E463D44|nr:DNA adenine methylase [Sulfurimonas sp. HSL-3221]UFS61561.1 DNA adenine methylase [Sulfurimonas sp. HSL-3221]